MQKILDRTQISLTQAFASLARNAKRQQRLYLATTVSLMSIVVASALLLAWLTADKQLDYRRALATHYAADISLLLHREESFLRRTELTVDFYQQTANVLRLPDEIEASIRRTGVARGSVGTEGMYFDVLVGEATRAAWGPALNANVWRIYEAGQSALVTQQAFELRHRAMLLGLNEDYGVILPATSGVMSGGVAAGGAAGAVSGGAAGVTSGAAAGATAGAASASAPLQPAVLALLRESLERQLQKQTGRRVPAQGERIWLGPYRDPLQGSLVMTAVSASYVGAKPTALIAMSIDVDAFGHHLARPGSAGVLLLLTAGRRVIVSSPPMSADTERMLQIAASALPGDTYRYTADGVILLEPLMRGFGWLVGYLSWRALIYTIGWQLAVLLGVTLLMLAVIALTARFWGLRLLRTSVAETTRALESETMNQILVSATPVGLCIVRQSDDAILIANVLAGELLRLAPGEPRLPPHIVDALHAQPVDVRAEAFAKIAVFVVPALAAPNDASYGPFLQVTYAPARHAGEDVLFCAILDVTAQHVLEQQLRLAQQNSEKMMRARSDFFAAMSHEIRTPLNALLGNLELFVRTPGLDAHAQRLAVLGVAADALRRIVNDILDFSKIDAGEMKPVTESFRPIDDLENLALSYVPMTADRAIRFYAQLGPSLDQVLCGDRARIVQIVNNLLSNAFKFTSCGKITLNAHVQEERPGRSVLVCRVCDSGIGMDPVLVSRIFNPFVQGEAGVSSRYGGTGLGLSICARLCELMGGHIAVESVPGVGSAFSVSIPLEVPPSVPGVPDAPWLAPAHRGSVLVLCQQAEAGQIVEGWLDRAGWTTCTVSSMRAAHAWLRTHQVDVLVVTGDYTGDCACEAIAELRDVQSASAVWITRTGPHRAALRADGVLEVSEFSHTAILAAVDQAYDANGANGADNPDNRDSAPIAEPAEVQTPTLDPALQGLAILVAEDNPLNQTLIAEQLSALGCVPTVVDDGQQALDRAVQTPFDAVLTDIHMPVMNGYQLVAALRARQAGLPVLAFSAITDNQHADAWSEHGFTAYVAKPASLADLAAALSTAMAARRGAAAPVVEAAANDQEPGPSDSIDADTESRYMAILKQQLSDDLPQLLTIVRSEDREALREWAHRAGGAFLVVRERAFAQECIELRRLCAESGRWTAAIAARAVALHGQLCERFGLG